MIFSFRILALVLALLGSGCAANRMVWGFDRGQFASKLYHGDYDFLRGLDYSHLSSGQILSLGDGAPFYMGLIFQHLGMEQQAQEMLKLAVDRSGEPWRRAAGLALIENFLDNQQYQKAADLGKELAANYPDSQDFAVLRTKALYWLERDQDTIAAVDRLLKDGGPGPLRDAAVRQLVDAGSPALWRAAASARIGAPDWKQATLDVFERYPASEIHARLYIFLQYRKQLYTAFSEAEKLLIEAKYQQSQRNYHEALAAYEKLMDLKDASPSKTAGQPDPTPLLSPDTIEDVGRTYSLLGQFSRGAARLERLSLQLVGDSRIATLDNAGRLYYRAGRYQDALRVLRASYALIAANNTHWFDARRRDRVIWYLLDSEFHAAPASAASALARYLPGISDSAYFSDTEEELLSTLVQKHQWESVAEVYAVLAESGEQGAAADFGVVLAEAIDKGLYRPKPAMLRSMLGDSVDAASGSQSMRAVIVALLKSAAGQSDDLFYRFVAAAALDELGVPQTDGSVMELSDSGAIPGAASTGSQPAATAGHTVGDADRLVSGYFAYGLLDEGYSEIRELWPRLSQQTLDVAAGDFAGRDRVTESLRTMDLARSKSDFLLGSREAKLLYPHAYPVEMDQAINKQHLDHALFYAVVREESYFESSVSSHAGAIGLSQLMPDTAADVARRMGLHSPDLADPATNLSIGAWYLRDLLDRFHEPVLALAAYNGGLGRVRQWRRSRDVPSLLLFHESIPLPETRSYIRKVLVSAVYYAYLYDGKPLSSVVSLFFPDLMSAGSGQ